MIYADRGITPRPKQDVKRQKKEGVMYEILHS